MVFVVGEQRAGRLALASLEAVAAARRIGSAVTLIVAGGDVGDACRSAAAAADVSEVIALEHPALADYTSDGFVMAFDAFVRAEAPSAVVFPHTYQTRDFAPALATRLGRPLVTDCTAVKPGPDGLVVSRPLFRGKVSADILLTGPGPHLVTVQIGTFRAEAAQTAGTAAPVRRVVAAVDPGSIRQRPDAPFREARQAVDLSEAERIVAVGRGIKDENHLAMAQSLAAALGAELAASRPICDAGWLAMDRQVGSSGQTVAPKLYVALGISGAIQHVVGMKGSKTIVAINKDPEAPIFEVADYGIVGDLFEIVPAMVAALAEIDD
jgi:electron transfer flavoprotein alpha subunit